MKRWFTLLVLVAGLCLPPQFTAFIPQGAEWTFTLQAKNKKAKKNKQKKAKKQKAAKSKAHRAPRVKAPRTAPKAGTALPLFSSSQPVSSLPQNPLLRVVLPKGTSNQTVNYKAITVYFNNQMRIPNCVAYELTNTMVAMADAPGAERRKNYAFNADTHVSRSPGGGDYRGSGYTRGHMAPAMDMRWDRQTMTECFLMTNMCPQHEKLNNGEWRQLEERIHRWAKRDGRLIILTGPIIADGALMSIGPRNDIAVPRAFYKVIYAPNQNRAIAFIYDNDSPKGGLQRHAVTINDVERRTHLNFLTSLPADTQRRIKAQCNLDEWK